MSPWFATCKLSCSAITRQCCVPKLQVLGPMLIRLWHEPHYLLPNPHNSSIIAWTSVFFVFWSPFNQWIPLQKIWSENAEWLARYANQHAISHGKHLSRVELPCMCVLSCQSVHRATNLIWAHALAAYNVSFSLELYWSSLMKCVCVYVCVCVCVCVISCPLNVKKKQIWALAQLPPSDNMRC